MYGLQVLSVMFASLAADIGGSLGGSLGFPYVVRNKDSWLFENLQPFEKKIEVINLLNMFLFLVYFIFYLFINLFL